MKVLVASPQGPATEALCGLLAKLDFGCEVEVVHDIPSLLSPGPATPSGMPDLVLVDMDAASSDSSAAIQRLLKKFPGVHILALGSRLDDAYVEMALEAGALGYLPKSHSETVTLSVLRLVLSGGTYRPYLRSDTNAVARPSASAAIDDTATRSDAGSLGEYGLTERQTEVLSLAAQGKSNLAIAKHLGIAEGTVKLHMSAIFKALNVQNRSEAVLLASRLQSVNFRQVKEAEGGAMDLDWLLPHMTHRHLSRDTIIFRKGDAGEELFYLQRGTIRLAEIGAEISAGTIFGEIGIFSPLHERTSTAVCSSDVDLFTLTSNQVKRLYLLNPQFALFVVHLISKRLMADRVRTI
ncbi:MAG TPA: LuxR C-terminal-related transcriptional regulator [Burkholderiales bacterium]|nr:LuxR C-terminal-related transcriptional regulator [Burkholderiales bacterium]